MQSIGCSVLSIILQEKRTSDFLKLKEEWFEQHELEAYKFIKSYYNTYRVLPTIETAETKVGLKAGVKEPYDYFLKELINRTVGNIIKKELVAINKSLNSADYLSVVNQLRELLSKTNIDITVNIGEVKTLSDLGELVLSRIRDCRNGVRLTGIPTGWQTLDEATFGLQRGDIFLILARLKMGKSMTLFRMANAAYEASYSPMVISMEMPAEQVARRFYADRLKLNMTMLNKAQISTWAEEKIEEEIKSVKDKHPFYYIDGHFKLTIQDIHRVVDFYRPDVLYIDGGYLIKTYKGDVRQRWEKMSDVAEGLKGIAMTFNIPIVVSFQFSRKVSRHTKSIGDDAMDNVQLADAIAQIASTGIAILKDEQKSDKQRIIEIIGGRQGEGGRFYINWDWETMNFDEVKLDNQDNFNNEEDEYDENNIPILWE